MENNQHLINIKTVDDKGHPIKTFVTLFFGDEWRASMKAATSHTLPSYKNYIGMRHEIIINTELPGWHQFRIDRCMDSKTVKMRKISDASLFWPRKFVAGTRSSSPVKDMTIGIIDGYPPASPPGLEHVKIINWFRGPNRISPTPEVMSHGITVANILSDFLSLTSNSASLNNSVKLRVYPIHCQKIDADYVVTADIIEAALQAAIVDGCDIINLSLGVPDEPADCITEVFEYFDRELRMARAANTILVAATGNTCGEHVRAPARADYVFGIGMAGLMNEAPEGSVAHALLNEAITAEDFCRTGHHEALGEIFVAGAVGPGANFVFPGCGICYTDNHGEWEEVWGTSFAAPIATAVIARIMSHMRESARGDFRTNVKADCVWDAASRATVRLGEAPWFATIRY